MNYSDYFEKTKGIGILSTADAKGRVDAAIFARPHFIDHKTCAFIMAERLTYKNLKSNPRAVYLFKEAGEKYAGKRLYLTKVRESEDAQLIKLLRRRAAMPDKQRSAPKKSRLVFFNLDSVLPLVGR